MDIFKMLMRVNILTLIPIDEKVILESTKKNME